MKKIVLAILLFVVSTINGFAQSVAINTDGSAADASALLDVKSINKGVLVPRMTKPERNTIASPSTGLLVYVNAPDTVGFSYYNGNNWVWIDTVKNTTVVRVNMGIIGGPTSSPTPIPATGTYFGASSTGADNYIILPQASTQTGRVIYIRNNNTVNFMFLRATAPSLLCPGNNLCIAAGGEYTMPSAANGKTVICISDGINWTIGLM
jgi:hypothetical protein